MFARKADVLPFTPEQMANDADLRFFEALYVGEASDMPGDPKVGRWVIHHKGYRYAFAWAKTTDTKRLRLQATARCRDRELIPVLMRISKLKLRIDVPRNSKAWQEHMSMLRSTFMAWQLAQVDNG